MNRLTRKGDLFHPLGRLSVVVMMQPTQNWTHANRTPYLLRFTRLRNLLLNPLMRSLTIIERDIFIQNPLNLILASQQKIVQHLYSHCLQKTVPFVVYVEMNPLLPDSPQQDLVFLLEQRVFREDNPF
jgi:hypothetical protein